MTCNPVFKIMIHNGIINTSTLLIIKDASDIRSQSGFIEYPMFFSLSGIRPESATIWSDIQYSHLFHFKILLLLYFEESYIIYVFFIL